MFSAKRLAIVPLTATLLSGCVVAIGNDGYSEDEHWEQQQDRNDHYLSDVQIGTHIDAVRAELGEAEFRDSFQRDGDVFEVLYYRTHHSHSDGKTTRDETTPVVFVAGRLVGYGPTAVANATR